MCLLMTTFGATLWAHTVLPFGAKGAVWAYGRVADFLCHIARVCLVTFIEGLFFLEIWELHFSKEKSVLLAANSQKAVFIEKTFYEPQIRKISFQRNKIIL